MNGQVIIKVDGTIARLVPGGDFGQEWETSNEALKILLDMRIRKYWPRGYDPDPAEIMSRGIISEFSFRGLDAEIISYEPFERLKDVIY